jgi:dTDP-4-amino-4,6-dideoxygalactose transaminase
MLKNLSVPFNVPNLLGTELSNVSRVIASGRFATGGTFTQQCSSMLSTIFGNKASLVTTSCTAALEIAAILLDLEPGDEVIIPAFTFVSTANAFASRGATVKFVDIEPDSLGIDPVALVRAMSSRTRAIVLVHYGGAPALSLRNVLEIAKSASVPVIEDNAHGFLGSVGGRLLGSFGALSTLSFHETKNISCGEGGALIINDSKFETRARVVHSKGTNRDAFLAGLVDKYTWQDFGSNFGISELSSSILKDQIASRESIQSRRKKIWDRYYSELKVLSQNWGVSLPTVAPQVRHAHHIFHLLMPNETQRDHFIAHMAEHSIQTCFHYPPLNLSPMALRLGIAVPCPVTEDISKRLVRLPLFSSLTVVQQSHVIEMAKAFFRRRVG